MGLQHALTSAASCWWLLPGRGEFGCAALPGSFSGPSSNMYPSSSLLSEVNLSSWRFLDLGIRGKNGIFYGKMWEKLWEVLLEGVLSFRTCTKPGSVTGGTKELPLLPFLSSGSKMVNM